MGTDSECDLAIEAGSPEERGRIADIRHRLLADHCGVSAGDVARVFAEGKNLIEASQMLSGEEHSLRPVDDQGLAAKAVIVSSSAVGCMRSDSGVKCHAAVRLITKTSAAANFPICPMVRRGAWPLSCIDAKACAAIGRSGSAIPST